MIVMDTGKTLYISDLDGTLLNKNSVLSEYTKNTLNKIISWEINFTVVTGRTTDAVQQIMSDVDLNIPIASFNGVVIYDTKQKRYEKVYRLAAEDIRKIIDVLKSHGASALVYELKGDALISYYESHNDTLIRDFIDDRKARYNSAFCQIDDMGDLLPEYVMYFTLMGTYDRIKLIYNTLQSLPGINMTMVKDTGFWWLEIFSAKASKGNAVMFLREMYGYKKIVGFGDNYNDLPMFKVCDVCVAVKNALDEIKADADYICESHDEDGVVKWIENHIK